MGVQFMRGTYNGTSHNLAAAIATIETLSEQGTYERMHGFGESLRKHIEMEADNFGIELVTSGLGSVFSVHFGLSNPPRDYADVLNANSSLYKEFRKAMLHKNMLLLPDGRWYIGAAHSEKELQKTKMAISEVLANFAAFVAKRS